MVAKGTADIVTTEVRAQEVAAIRFGIVIRGVRIEKAEVHNSLRITVLNGALCVLLHYFLLPK